MLVYLHGFNSSAESAKARFLDEFLRQRELQHLYVCPSLPHQPLQAMAVVEAAINPGARTPLCFIGSSLGGFYATCLAEKYKARAVLVNPAIDPHIGLRAYLGPQSNLHTGEQYQLSQTHLDEWESLNVGRITPERYLLLLETGDEVLDYRQAQSRYAGARQVVVQGGDHSLQSFPRHVPAILAFAGIDAD